MASTERTGLAKAAAGAIWVLVVLEVVGMGAAGWAKFGSPDTWTAMFEGWGYPAWFAFVVGAAELGGALLLIVPRFTSYAGALLTVIMVGALGTVLLHPGRMGPGVPVIHLIVLSVLVAARWKVRWRNVR